MTDNEIIATQAKEIYHLKNKLEDYRSMARNINKKIYCIGGPLNDNKLGFTYEQMKLFWEIACLVNFTEHGNESDESDQ